MAGLASGAIPRAARPPVGPLPALLFLALALGASGYYVPGTYPQEFKYGEKIQAKVNSLTSYDTELPFEYYSLPFCEPKEGIRRFKHNANPGTMLMGKRVESSPYNFNIMINQKGIKVCTKKTSKEDAEILKKRVDEEYQVNMILDNLPITMYQIYNEQDKDYLIKPGFPLGIEQDGKYYINNHLIITIFVHPTHGQYSNFREEASRLAESNFDGRRLMAKGDRTGMDAAYIDLSGGDLSGRSLLQVLEGKYANWNDTQIKNSMYMIVGFEVYPCSVRHTANETVDSERQCLREVMDGQEIKEGVDISYTYEVVFLMSEVEWASRWDAYLRMPGGKVHWFSILNSLMVVMVMAVVCAMILIRTVRRDLAQYEELLMDGGTSAADLKEEAGWKMVSGDVFRCPGNPIGLAVRLGSGVQIISTCAVTLLFAAVGFLSPAARGSLLTALLVLYMLLAVGAGFAGVWLWGMLMRTYEGWKAVCWRVSVYFPGTTLLVLTFLNLLIKGTGSTGAIPASTYFSILFLWFLVSIPLTFLGGYMAARLPIREYPVRTNQIPRHIPAPPLSTNPWLLFLVSGLLPFGTLFLELYFMMTSMWMGFYYYLFGYLALILILTIIITIEVSVLCTYVQLCTEDYHWWWRSFTRGGSIALYLMMYAAVFLFTMLRNLEGFLPFTLYTSYMGIVVWGSYLAMGTVGFISSFGFNYFIFGSVKVD